MEVPSAVTLVKVSAAPRWPCGPEEARRRTLRGEAREGWRREMVCLFWAVYLGLGPVSQRHSKQPKMDMFQSQLARKVTAWAPVYEALWAVGLKWGGVPRLSCVNVVGPVDAAVVGIILVSPNVRQHSGLGRGRQLQWE